MIVGGVDTIPESRESPVSLPFPTRLVNNFDLVKLENCGGVVLGCCIDLGGAQLTGSVEVGEVFGKKGFGGDIPVMFLNSAGIKSSRKLRSGVFWRI